MATPEQRIEKLKKLLEVASEDTATPQDLVKLAEAFVVVITKEREKLTARIEAESGLTAGQLARLQAQLDQKERTLKQLISQLYEKATDTTASLSKRLTAELKRLERKIPSKTDLSGIEAQIEAIRDALTSVPTEITANPESVRDALELLLEDGRLHRDYIDGLDDYEELRELVKTLHPSNFNIGKVIRSIRAGAGITIDLTDPNNPIITSNGGAGSNYETPIGAVDGVNTTYTVSAEPKCIFYFGTPLFEGPNGYSRSGLTITMPYAPASGTEDQFKAVI